MWLDQWAPVFLYTVLKWSGLGSFCLRQTAQAGSHEVRGFASGLGISGCVESSLGNGLDYPLRRLLEKTHRSSRTFLKHKPL